MEDLIATTPLEPKLETGLVGYFDVLGYQQLLERKDIAGVIEAVSIAFDTARLEAEVRTCLESFSTDQTAAGLVKNLRWICFSDTIVVCIPHFPDKIPNCTVDLGNRIITSVFLLACRTVMFDMFEKGFPVRGAITGGEYYAHPNRRMFAGAPIIEAYRLSAEQEWIGCLIAPSATKQIAASSPDYDGNALIVSYPVPMKSGLQSRSAALNWAFPGMRLRELQGAAREVLFQNCLAHGKGIDSTVITKVNNTEAFLAYCRKGPTAKFGPEPYPLRQRQ